MEGTKKRVLQSFFKHRLGVFGLIVLCILYLLVLFADFIAPYNFTETHTNFVYAPPSKIRFRDQEGKWIGPHIYEMKRSRDPVTFQVVFTEDTTKPVPIKFFVRGEEYRFLGLFKPISTSLGWRQLPTRLCCYYSEQTASAETCSLEFWSEVGSQ